MQDGRRSSLPARCALLSAGVAWLIGCCGLVAQAQGETPAPAATPAPVAARIFVLVPYEEPGSKDPHAPGLTQTLEIDLQAKGIATKTSAPIAHLDAVSGAAQLCADNGATGLLIAEGRYEQTTRTTMIPMMPVQISTYPSHVELRLDEIDCSGVVVATTHATGDRSTAGANMGFGSSATNVGSVVDAGFRNAVAAVVTDLAQALASSAAAVAAPTTPAPAPSSAVPAGAAYLLVPFEQPNLADPRSPDITKSFSNKLADRKVSAKVATPIDHLTAVAQAPALCAQNGVSAIIVPSVRLEAAKRTHAELRLYELDCGGHVIARALSEADINYPASGKGMIRVAEQAMDAALDQLFSPSAK